MFGLGYVGLSLAVLLSRKHSVVAIDILSEKIESIKNGQSPIADVDIERELSKKNQNLIATTDSTLCKDADFIIISTPTNYDIKSDMFDTSSIISVISEVNDSNPNCTIVIKSTIPTGFTEQLYEDGIKNVLFSPEFLREGKALYDNLQPSRIIVGIPHNDERLKNKAEEIAQTLKECSEKKDAEVLIMRSTEAEAVKLFSNTYLAMRVSFFNELDSFAESNGLNSKNIISGVSLDPRIGMYYNNPSFGYGGYCLPKDTMQLISSFKNVPAETIKSIPKSNQMRKNYIANKIIKMARGNTVGAYRLAMKSGSDNFRESSIIDVLDILKTKGIETMIYDPTIQGDSFRGHKIHKDLNKFKTEVEVIIANRMDQEIADVAMKVYTRDVFHTD